MTARILSAIICIPILIYILCSAPLPATVTLVSILSVIAAYELLYRTRMVLKKRYLIPTFASAISIPWLCYLQVGHRTIIGVLTLLYSALFIAGIIDHAPYKFGRICMCVFAGVIFPYMLSAMIRLQGSGELRIRVLIPFVIAFITDSSSFFIGGAWGKKKLAPNVSPNKTIAGVIGGIVCCIISMMVFAYCITIFSNYPANYLISILYGVVGSFAAILGDLCFSMIKREARLKDFGNLIPGHGGILDRFDSVSLVLIVTEYLLSAVPLIP